MIGSTKNNIIFLHIYIRAVIEITYSDTYKQITHMKYTFTNPNGLKLLNECLPIWGHSHQITKDLNRKKANRELLCFYVTYYLWIHFLSSEYIMASLELCLNLKIFHFLETGLINISKFLIKKNCIIENILHIICISK